MTSEKEQAHSLLDVRPSLRDKVALVSGGLGGIGRACVRVLHAHGARVAFTYADGQESPTEAATIVAAAPERLSAHALELRSEHSIRECVKTAHDRWGQLDILVNNAAVGSATVAAYATDPGAQDSSLFAINADGALKLVQAFLAPNAARWHSSTIKIINVSSVGGGVQAFPHFRLADGMSKAAVAFLTRQLAAEHTGTRVEVFAVCPGATNTRMFAASTLDHLTEEERVAYLRRLPKGRLIESEEMARLILFLASEYAAPLHGAVLDASMGLGVRPGLLTEGSH